MSHKGGCLKHEIQCRQKSVRIAEKTANDGTDATIAICSFVHGAGTMFIAANQATKNQNAATYHKPTN